MDLGRAGGQRSDDATHNGEEKEAPADAQPGVPTGKILKALEMMVQAKQEVDVIVDIIKEEATMLVPNDFTKTMAEASFGVTVDGDSVVLPGVMSRKKQIIPNLKTS